MSDLGLLSNPYAQAMSAFPEGINSLIQNGQYPSIAGGQSSGFDGSYHATPVQLQQLFGMGSSMAQSQPRTGQQMQAPPMMQSMPFSPIQLRGLLPSNQQPLGAYKQGSF